MKIYTLLIINTNLIFSMNEINEPLININKTIIFNEEETKQEKYFNYNNEKIQEIINNKDFLNFNASSQGIEEIIKNYNIHKNLNLSEEEEKLLDKLYHMLEVKKQQEKTIKKVIFLKNYMNCFKIGITIIIFLFSLWNIINNIFSDYIYSLYFIIGNLLLGIGFSILNFFIEFNFLNLFSKGNLSIFGTINILIIYILLNNIYISITNQFFSSIVVIPLIFVFLIFLNSFFADVIISIKTYNSILIQQEIY